MTTLRINYLRACCEEILSFSPSFSNTNSIHSITTSIPSLLTRLVSQSPEAMASFTKFVPAARMATRSMQQSRGFVSASGKFNHQLLSQLPSNHFNSRSFSSPELNLSSPCPDPEERLDPQQRCPHRHHPQPRPQHDPI